MIDFEQNNTCTNLNGVEDKFQIMKLFRKKNIFHEFLNSYLCVLIYKLRQFNAGSKFDGKQYNNISIRNKIFTYFEVPVVLFLMSKWLSGHRHLASSREIAYSNTSTTCVGLLSHPERVNDSHPLSNHKTDNAFNRVKCASQNS